MLPQIFAVLGTYVHSGTDLFLCLGRFERCGMEKPVSFDGIFEAENVLEM